MYFLFIYWIELASDPHFTPTLCKGLVPTRRGYFVFILRIFYLFAQIYVLCHPHNVVKRYESCMHYTKYVGIDGNWLPYCFNSRQTFLGCWTKIVWIIKIVYFIDLLEIRLFRSPLIIPICYINQGGGVSFLIFFLDIQLDLFFEFSLSNFLKKIMCTYRS